MSARAKPRIAILAMGGTIAAVADSSIDQTQYREGALPVEEMLASVPHLQDFADIQAEKVASLNSDDITHDDWCRLSARIHACIENGCNGIVVTHGTDTLEETAYFLSLTVTGPVPVVITGSMRPSTSVSADGPLNLLQAVCVAASPESRNRGVLIVLNGTILSARTGMKMHTMNVEAFADPFRGNLGTVIDTTPLFLGTELRPTFSVPVTQGMTFPRVDILFAHIEMPADSVEFALSHCAGLVLAGAGNGRMPASIARCLSHGSGDCTVVRASRVGCGLVTPREEDAQSRFIAAGILTPQKARILLMLALTTTRNSDQIRKIFSRA